DEPVCYPVRRAIHAGAWITCCSTASPTKMRTGSFMGKERPKVLAYATELAGTELARAFLAPLESGMTVALSEKARPQGFSGLNRHMVLHGESTDYGTKENGLRAISLLNYISQSLQRELSAPDESVAETERTPMPPIDS
ncbi:hypothetical protein ACOIY0_30870, partial [Burkholderia contaminans]